MKSIYRKVSQIITLTWVVISPTPAPSLHRHNPVMAPASFPSPPPLNLFSCLSAPLFRLPLSPVFKYKAAHPSPSPSLLSVCLFLLQAAHSISLLLPLAISASIPMNAQSPPFRSGRTALGQRRGKEESSANAHTNSITKTHSPSLPNSCVWMHVCVFVCTSAEAQEHGGWQTGVEGLGGVLMALNAGNGLLLHRQLQNQLSLQATSPYFTCISKTHTFVHSWVGSTPPPTNDYAKTKEKKTARIESNGICLPTLKMPWHYIYPVLNIFITH